MSWFGNPQTSIGTFLWHGGSAFLNQHIFKIDPPAAHWRSFMYCLLRELQPQFVELARSKQTTGLGHVTQGDLRLLYVARPPDVLAQAFDRRLAPIFAGFAGNGALLRAREHLLVALTTGAIPAPWAD